jgi:hypothetical protein
MSMGAFRRHRGPMLAVSRSALAWRGVLAVLVGVVAVIWPGITLGAFVILFAVFALLAAGTDVVRAFSGRRAGPLLGYLLLADHAGYGVRLLQHLLRRDGDQPGRPGAARTLSIGHTCPGQGLTGPGRVPGCTLAASL